MFAGSCQLVGLLIKGRQIMSLFNHCIGLKLLNFKKKHGENKNMFNKILYGICFGCIVVEKAEYHCNEDSHFRSPLPEG